MGIPQLLQTFEKLKKPETKSFPVTDENGASPHRPAAVIDGSALAYHILSRYLKNLSKENRVPSILGFEYAAYQRSVVSWLREIEYGFKIIGIYIDGHLPLYKTETRISRIQTSIAHLSRLRTLSTSTIDLSKTPNFTPTPPLLIAAFTQAILNHDRWKELVATVPGEADAFCAKAAWEYSSSTKDDLAVVFTSDSDLVVYPARGHTRVAVFNDVVFETGADGKRRVKVSLWAPGHIEKILGGDGDSERIMRLAWCLLYDPMKVAKAVSGSNKGASLKGVVVGKEFAEQYTFPVDIEEDSIVPPRVILDSRAAEVIYSSQIYGKYRHPPSSPKGVEVPIYLPVLVEDLSKSSAWAIGRGFRTTAYKLLFNKDTVIQEMHRKGVAVNKTHIRLANETTEDNQLAEDGISELPNELNEVKLKIVFEILAEYENKNAPLAEVDILALLAATTKLPTGSSTLPTTWMNQWTWPRTHLFAQLMAGAWSLYLLKTVAYLPNLNKKGIIDDNLIQLLSSFPELLDVMDAQRFMAVYTLVPADRKGMSKKAKARARKKVKLEHVASSDGGSVKGFVKKLFTEEDWKGVESVLKIVGDMRRAREEELEDDEEETSGAHSYMGMTIG
ncbi:hypothetical protein H072_6640 [Dactylellina haptotyla CBS 200.50]|uniref:Asteroid domain-containing protein n=1 Tax=Dactylellina haptotyla (strain CBS 200.50) TaxID=1284197 RepID=S8AEI6_DACHA|nr:hypothetical protein H072_6640 [Dactylellina haptotyla CBS 200.50]